MTVNPAKVMTPGNLRAFMAKHRITSVEVAHLRDCTPQAINAAILADCTGRPVSQRLLREIWDVLTNILLKREQEAPCR